MYKHFKCFPAGHLHAPFATGHNTKNQRLSDPSEK